ncbi:MAG: S46 family peptidase, partial [Chitinophagaceae bacterium]
MRNLRLFLLFVSLSFKSFADEGMWLPYLLGQLNEKEMKAMGMKITAKDIYDINKGSLKDAIVQFGGGCTGEIISEQGLVLTNHHCGYGAIQRLSTLENNYVNNGFWSQQQSAELPSPGSSVTFISRMEDVTALVLKEVTNKMTEPERQSTIDKKLTELKSTYKKETYENITIRPFYNGSMYVLIATVTYNDVRLVGAPPASIGAFGADTDNWVWPRHGGDFSIFRIYAGADNKPAPYNASNVPYKPKKSLSISLKGVKEGDFTMVFGFPGRTNEYLPAIAVQQTLELNNPIKIQLREVVLKAQKDFMQNDAGIKLQYSAKYAGIANAWKKWIGENLGLQSSGAVAKKKAYEQLFQKRLQANPAFITEYGTVLTDINTLYEAAAPYFYIRDAFNETVGNSEILNQALGYLNLEKMLTVGYTEPVKKEKETLLAAAKAFYKDYSAKVDEQVLARLLEVYFTKTEDAYHSNIVDLGYATNYKENAAAIAHAVFENSFLTNIDQLKAAFEKTNDDLLTMLSNDKAFQLAKLLRNNYVNTAAKKVAGYQDNINKLQRLYMQAQMAVMKDKRFYPDANSTLRITYGKVKGYQPKDGVQYHYYTYLDGVMEKYIPGDYEFDVPEKLRTLYKNKD